MEIIMKKFLVSLLISTMLVASLNGCKSDAKDEKVTKNEATDENDNEDLEVEDDTSDNAEDIAADEEVREEADNTNNDETTELSDEERHALYEDFLFNDGLAYCVLEDRDVNEFMLTDIIDYYEDFITDEFFGDGEDHFEQTERGYAYFDGGLDGNDELVVYQKYDNEGYDEFIYYMFFNIENNMVNHIYTENNSSRGYTTVTEAGIITNGGSNGASSSTFTKSFISADGERVFDYLCDTEMDLSMAVIPYYYIPDIIVPSDYPSDLYSGGDEPIGCDSYTFEDFDYYSDYADEDYMAYLSTYFFCFCDSMGKDINPDSSVINFYDEHGIEYYGAKEIQDMLTEHEAELGLTEEANAMMQVIYKDF